MVATRWCSVRAKRNLHARGPTRRYALGPDKGTNEARTGGQTDRRTDGQTDDLLSTDLWGSLYRTWALRGPVGTEYMVRAKGWDVRLVSAALSTADLDQNPAVRHKPTQRPGSTSMESRDPRFETSRVSKIDDETAVSIRMLRSAPGRCTIPSEDGQGQVPA
ncbi:hypothetical protein UVI_02018460 [Ustilaginoidea virens]|uniref:Uncharacterized protein n=1 Tax=Ustilaginoidea virens TaxID=1159556 RepID=A0A1B5KSA3_USTVR|nr:hypothetical protein UVI_02018460 [Ustilaginoidea virens]